MVGLNHKTTQVHYLLHAFCNHQVYIYMFMHTIYSYTYKLISTYPCLLVCTYKFLLNQIFLATHTPYEVQTWYCAVYVSKASLFKSCIFQLAYEKPLCYGLCHFRQIMKREMNL